MIAKKFIISGLVQGVFFRQNTLKVAEKLGISGWAKNLPDGTVEVVAHGESDDIDNLQSWLKHGPPAAHVKGIIVENFLWEKYDKITNFKIT